MTDLFANPELHETYQRLAGVRLNPRRHTAANALVHSEAVASLAGRLAQANGCSAEEVALLETLGRVHDIGKVLGNANPERSLDVLREHGVEDPKLLALVKWHDTGLPWYRAHQRGEPPTDKAWRRLANAVDMRLLAMFMVADRVDAPPGWRRNAPTVWFLEQARRRGHGEGLVLDLPDHPSEVSGGAAVVREGPEGLQALLIRVRRQRWELPKGGIEFDELPERAALREAHEETGIEGELEAGPELGHVQYRVGQGDGHLKRVRFFAARAPADATLGRRPGGTRDRAWVTREQLDALELIDEQLRPLIERALNWASS